MRVGIYFDLRNPPGWRREWPELYGRALEQIEEAERLGVGSVWVSEHHGFDDGYMGQPLLACAAIAARTSRVRIGTAVLVAPLRPPIDIAEQAAMVDILSGGRLELGLGAGYRIPEFALFGQDVKQRFALLEERVREVRRMWGDGSATPAPVQEPLPMWLGVIGPRGARLAGRLGTGLLWLSPRLMTPYREGLEEGGHDPAQARCGGLLNLFLADDPEAARAQVKPYADYQRSSYARYAAEGRGDSRPATRALSTDEDPGFAVVTPEEAAERVRTTLAELPVSDVFLWASIGGMPDELSDRHVELVATRLAPALAGGGLAA